MITINASATEDKEPGLVIIGSGFAGYHTAKQWRLLDQTASLTIITEHGGSFYSKPQLSTLQAKSKAPEALVTKTAEQMAEELDATILAETTVTEIDRAAKNIVLANGELIPYKQCVVATGAIVHRLPLPQSQQDLMFSVNNLEDYYYLQKQLERKKAKKLVIIGSGLVGCELANDFIQSGFEVTVISNEAYPMGRLMPEALGTVFKKVCEDAGIRFIMQANIEAVEKQGNDIVVQYDGQTIAADAVISAIGFKPNVALAKQAGLTIDYGIVVNNQFQTSDTDIYAIGDCAIVENNWRPFIAPILHGGKVLAKVLAGDDQATMAFPVMPVIAKTPLCKVQGVYDHPEKMKTYRVEIDPSQLKSFYYNDKDELKAFVLLGDAVTERPQWVEKLVLG